MTETTTSERRRRAVALLAAALSLFASVAWVNAQSGSCRQDVAGAWTPLSPNFPQGPAEVVSVATQPFDRDRVFVANARSIVRSADGGCTFRDALTLDELGLADDARIVQLELTRDDASRVFAIVEEPTPVPRPHVVLSTDGGATWRLADTGLEGTVGAPLAFAAAVDAGPIYLLVGPSRTTLGDTEVSTSWSLYRTGLSPITWERRTEVTRVVGVDPVLTSEPTEIRSMVLDPFDGDDVWLYGPSGLYRTRDGGTTLTEALERPISDVVLFRGFNLQPRTLAFDAEAPRVYTAFGDGISFFEVRLPTIVHSAAGGRSSEEVVVSTALGRVLHVPTVGRSAEDVSAATPAFDLRSVIVGRDLTVFARSRGLVLRLFLPGPANLGDPDIPPLPHVDPGSFDRPTLRPGRARILLAPGERRRLPVRLYLPGTRKVDVYFLLDTSGSMGEEISGLRAAIAAIVRALGEEEIDAHFGIGQYRGPAPAYNMGGDVGAYERVRDIALPSDDLTNALGDMGASGDGPESMLLALEQSVTGDGAPDANVRPGQQANFRPGALRVILHFADETFNEGGTNPTIPEVGATLAAARVLQIGLAFQDDAGLIITQGPNPAQGMRELARRTNAVAPSAGADCNGDGAAEIGRGQPLVCVIDPSRSQDAAVVAPAIVGLLAGLEDRADVRLEAKGPPGTVVGTTPEDGVSGVDFKMTQQLGFGVTLTCPAGALGRSFPIDLRATARGGTLATAATEVVCGVPAVIIPPPNPPPIVAQIPPAPQPVPQQHPQSQPQAHAQGAFAAERQEQPQLAYGYVNPKRDAPVPAREAPEERFEMSSATGTSAVPPAATFATGAAMAVAAVALSRRRNRTQPVLARASTNRRRR